MKAIPTRLTVARPQIGCQGYQRACLQRHEAVITDQLREGSFQVLTHIVDVEGFESPIVGLVKQDHNRHDFTQTETWFTPTLALPTCQQLLFPVGLEDLAEVVDFAEHFRYIHFWTPFFSCFQKAYRFLQKVSSYPELTLLTKIICI